jgi:hypothetical protein
VRSCRCVCCVYPDDFMMLVAFLDLDCLIIVTSVLVSM